MNPEENMDDHHVFIPISEKNLSELSSIDSYTVSNMAKELIMLRSEVLRLRDQLVELNLGIDALIGEKQAKNGDWVSIDSLKSQGEDGKRTTISPATTATRSERTHPDGTARSRQSAPAKTRRK